MSMNASFRAKPEMDPLEREAREIERRRARYADRTKRILHAKTRILGTDTNTLSQQVKDKQERERLELERDRHYDEIQKQHSQMITENINRAEDQKAKEREELSAYRVEQQRERRTRTLTAESGVRALTDFDTTFLKFAGEDPDKLQRTRAQQDQQQDWLRQQIEDLKLREAKEREEHRDYHATVLRIGDLQKQHRDDADQEAAEEAARYREFNIQLSAEKKAKERLAVQVEQKNNDEEVTNALNSVFLNEATTMRYDKPGNQPIPYHFKGFTVAQRQAILDEQKQQQDDLRRKREDEIKAEQDYNRQQEEYRREIVRADKARQEAAARERERVMAERKVQHKESTVRKQYLDSVVYQNPVHDSYFEQFGTSCR